MGKHDFNNAEKAEKYNKGITNKKSHSKTKNTHSRVSINSTPLIETLYWILKHINNPKKGEFSRVIYGLIFLILFLSTFSLINLAKASPSMSNNTCSPDDNNIPLGFNNNYLFFELRNNTTAKSLKNICLTNNFYPNNLFRFPLAKKETIHDREITRSSHSELIGNNLYKSFNPYRNIINEVFIKQFGKFGFQHPNCIKAKDFFENLIKVRQYAQQAIAGKGRCEEATANVLRNYYLDKAHEILADKNGIIEQQSQTSILQVYINGKKTIEGKTSNRDHVFVIFTSNKINTQEFAHNFKKFLNTFAEGSEICDDWNNYFGNSSIDWFNDFEKNPVYQNVEWRSLMVLDRSIPFHDWDNARLFYNFLQIILDFEENAPTKSAKEIFNTLHQIVIDDEKNLSGQAVITKTLDK